MLSGKKSNVTDDFNQLETIPNRELSYRQTNCKLTGIDRIYSYFSAPIIKFLNHLVNKNFNFFKKLLKYFFKISYVIFLFVFSGFLLFDYYPDVESRSTIIRITVYEKKDFIKVTATELVVIICVIIYLTDEIREVKKKILI